MATKISVAREALLPALALAGKAVERRSTIPILQNVALAASGGRMSVTGSDLDCEIVATLPAPDAQDLSITLPAQTLHDAVKKLPDGAEITLVVEDNFTTVMSGRSRFRLQTLPPSDFPSMASGDLPVSFSIEATTLRAMIDTVSFAISTEETRYYLNGIHLHAKDGYLIAVATDGHRLARWRILLPEGAADMPPIIIPRRTVSLMQHIIGDKGDVHIALSDTKIRFESAAGGSLLSKLIDGTFPDYVRVIPTGNANRFTVPRKALAAAIDRVTTIASERSSAVKFGFGTDGMLTLESSNPDNGSATDELNIRADDGTSGEGLQIGFNGRYALDMLSASACDEMDFVLGDAGAPALIEPTGGNDLGPLFVLMPMRI